MRQFLNFVLKNRLRMVLAVFVALALPLPFFPLAGVTLVGLICLRSGLRTGSQVFLGACLPALILAFLQGSFPASFTSSLLIILWVMGLAIVLRESSAWSRTLLVNVAYVFMVSCLLYFLAGDVLQAGWEEMLAMLEESVRDTLPTFSTFALATSFAYSISMISVLCLIVARYLQALLYNPGGFRQEFHSLRLNPLSAAFLGVPGVSLVLLGALGFVEQGGVVSLAGQVLLMPHLFAGISLAHGMAGRRPGGGKFLVPFYLLLLARWGRLLLVVLAIADSRLDFRRRYLPPPSSGPANDDKSNTREE